MFLKFLLFLIIHLFSSIYLIAKNKNLKQNQCVSIENVLLKDLCFFYSNDEYILKKKNEYLSNKFETLYSEIIYGKISLLDPLLYGIEPELMEKLSLLKESILNSMPNNSIDKIHIISELIYNYNSAILNISLCNENEFKSNIMKIFSIIKRNKETFNFEYKKFKELNPKNQCIFGEGTITYTIYWNKKNSSNIAINQTLYNEIRRMSDTLKTYRINYILNTEETRDSFLKIINSELENNDVDIKNYKLFKRNFKLKNLYYITILVEKIWIILSNFLQ